jgi:hypothetical protein
MGGATPVHALVTALLCTAILIPMLRLAIAPHGAGLLARHAPALAGGVSVFFATAALLPMGGDGMMVPFADPQLAFALLFALGLLVLGSTRLYRELHPGLRLGLQLVLAFLATLGGQSPAGAGAARFLLTVTALVLGMNTLQSLRAVRALPTACAALLATFFAIVARAFPEPGIGELNLGLCGALVTLLVFSRAVGKRLRAELGTGGRLAVGFLLATTALRLLSQTIPEARPWLLLPYALPLVAILVQLLATASSLARWAWVRYGVRERLQGRIPVRFGIRLRFRQPDLGLTPRELLLLGSLACAIANLAALRLLGLLA